MSTDVRKPDANLTVRYYRCSKCGSLTMSGVHMLQNISEILRVLGFRREEREPLERDIRQHPGAGMRG